jgi:hypothetical protein
MLTAIIVFIASSVLFMGKGLTGYYLLDFEPQKCESDAACLNGDVCCPFSGKNYGVCDKASKCNSIKSLTNNELSQITSYEVYGSIMMAWVFAAIAALVYREYKR